MGGLLLRDITKFFTRDAAGAEKLSDDRNRRTRKSDGSSGSLRWSRWETLELQLILPRKHVQVIITGGTLGAKLSGNVVNLIKFR